MQWFIVIDLSTNRPAYGGDDRKKAAEAYGGLKTALFGIQDRSGMAIRTLATYEK